MRQDQPSRASLVDGGAGGLAKIFVSYSHRDGEEYYGRLRTHLTPLLRQGLIEPWSDHEIVAGAEIDREIGAAMEAADIFLLLVSPDYLASDYCYGRELKRAMERHEAGTARVIPIILRVCQWMKGTPFAKLKAVPKDGKPISKWPDRDEAFDEAAREIARAVEKWREAQGAGAAASGSASGPVRIAPAASATPPWAKAAGEDGFGRWLNFSVPGSPVTQRMRWIPPGRFLMGSPITEAQRSDDEGPQHEVTIGRSFWLFDTACTQALWQAVMGTNPSSFEGADRPVETVSWDDCSRFIDRINKLVPGLDLALPTEAQWEYACRAGTTTPFSFGSTITPEQVNFDGNHPYVGGVEGFNRRQTVPVASLPPNPWGLHEMHGNVWEWCADPWHEHYQGARADGDVWIGGGALRVLRGGSWLGVARRVRAACRYSGDPGSRRFTVGFRCARVQA
jgi:formylglycine-generating enzyme required for sulfatase activity